MDQHITCWVTEFLLRHSTEEGMLNAVLHVLPLPAQNLRLKKLLLLKKLEFDAQTPVSESTLDILEDIVHTETLLKASVGKTVEAYRAAVMQCTLHILKDGDSGRVNARRKFFEAVRRIWKGRFQNMKKILEEQGLWTEVMCVSVEELERAVWQDDDSSIDKFVKIFEVVDAAKVIQTYIREEMQEMGPSILDKVLEIVKGDKGLQEALQVDVEGAPCKGVSKTILKMREHKRSRGLTQRGAIIADFDKKRKGPETSYSAEINELSSEGGDDLKSMEAISSDDRDRKRCPSLEEDKNVTGKLMEVDDGGVGGSGAKNVAGPSSEDSDMQLQDPELREPIRLDSPERLSTSPLRKYEPKTVKLRKTSCKWSDTEVEALRLAVRTCGAGNWAAMLKTYPDSFPGRRYTDLRCKWRSLKE